MNDSIRATVTVDSAEYDITENLRVLYDTCIQSLDWGSGFLDDAEMVRILQVGAAAGWCKVSDVIAVSGLWGYYSSHVEPSPTGPGYREWDQRRQEWCTNRAAQEYGDPPTWSGLARLLDRVEGKCDDVTGFDE